MMTAIPIAAQQPVASESIGQPGRDFRMRQIGAQQPHAAVDVVADAAGRDHAALGGRRSLLARLRKSLALRSAEQAMNAATSNRQTRARSVWSESLAACAPRPEAPRSGLEG